MTGTLKECKVVMLPTKQASRLVVKYSNNIQYLDKVFSDIEEFEARGYTPQHLYVYNDDSIDEDDFFIDTATGEIHIASDTHVTWENEYKIIASTDPELSLPSFSTGFVQKYAEVRGIGMDRILVEYEANINSNPHFTTSNMSEGYKRRLRALKESSGIGLAPKLRPDNTIITHPVKTEWSREEVDDLIRRAVGESHDWSREK